MSGERLGEWHEWPFEPLEILLTMARFEVEFVVVGGLAAILQGSPLPTYSVDIAWKPGERNRGRLLVALSKLNAMTLTAVPDTEAALEDGADPISFYTSCGHIDVYRRLAGFASFGDLRRNSVGIELGEERAVRALTLRGIIHSKVAAGDMRQLPAIEATLERTTPQ